MEETFQSNTLDWSSLVFFLSNFSLSPNCFKSIGPEVGIRLGPRVLLGFIIGKTLYTVRRDKNFF